MVTETITFVDPDGGATLLADLRGITGRMLPPIRYTSSPVPGQPGERVRQVVHGPRPVVVPVVLDDPSMVGYRDLMRDLARSLDPTRGDGTLRVSTIDGLVRELTCRYLDGFTGLEEYPSWSTPSLLFQAADPYWYDDADTQTDFTLGGSPATFFPIFPLRLSSSEVFAATTVDNVGDVEAWPVWVITGPGSGLVLRNLTTGEMLGLDHDFAAGDMATIDTRPGQKTVVADDGTNLFGELIDLSSLWALAVGSNSIQVEMGGATEASTLTLRRRHRYLTA